MDEEKVCNIVVGFLLIASLLFNFNYLMSNKNAENVETTEIEDTTEKEEKIEICKKVIIDDYEIDFYSNGGLTIIFDINSLDRIIYDKDKYDYFLGGKETIESLYVYYDRNLYKEHGEYQVVPYQYFTSPHITFVPKNKEDLGKEIFFTDAATTAIYKIDLKQKEVFKD